MQRRARVANSSLWQSRPEEFVMIDFSWDSGPYGTQYESSSNVPELEGPNGYGSNTVPIPKEIWERYRRAEAELRAAESALAAAEQAFLEEARQHDPRWQEERRGE